MLEKRLIDTINKPDIKQIDIIKQYQGCIEAIGEDIDFKAINQAIISKWSLSALERIKEAAWKWRFE